MLTMVMASPWRIVYLAYELFVCVSVLAADSYGTLVSTIISHLEFDNMFRSCSISHV